MANIQGTSKEKEEEKRKKVSLTPEGGVDERQGKGAVTWKGVTWVEEETAVRENIQLAMRTAFIYHPHGRGTKQQHRTSATSIKTIQKRDKFHLGLLKMLGCDLVPWTEE